MSAKAGDSGRPKSIIYPLFQMKRGVPLPEHLASGSLGGDGAMIDVNTNPTVFYAK
jgi:hypothetical protein